MMYELGPRASGVYQVLLDRIRSGELAPGTRMPAHTQLATSFGVAPLTMRLVLARLEADRLVVRERGRGTFVRATGFAESQSILIVAAERALLADLQQQVRSAGNQPLLAATAAEALATLEREAPPALAIVDLRLPGASAGLRLVRRLRQRLSQLPIAVLNPTRTQRRRLERTVDPPLLFLADSRRDQLAQMLKTNVPARAEATLATRLELLQERYMNLQLAGERASARSLILQDGLAAGMSIVDLYRSVLQPAQYRVGQLWQGNQINVAREHLATAVTETLMVELAASAPRQPNKGMTVLVACVEGELHDIGARMVADLVELDGFTVRFLGADVPKDSLLAVVGEESPRLVILSATMADRVAELRAAVGRLRRAYGPGLRIFAGGHAMDWMPGAVRALEVDLAARDVLETLSAARRLLDSGDLLSSRSVEDA